MKANIKYFAAISAALIALSGTVAAQDSEPPTTPTGLIVTETHNQSIGISWNPSTDNVGIDGYRIYVNDGYWGYSEDNEYLVANLGVNTAYTIEVSAFDTESNESGRSTAVTPTTTTSTITGITYLVGAPMPLVTLTLNGQGLINVTTQTDLNGQYSFYDLKPGVYTVTDGGLTHYIEAVENHTTIQDFHNGGPLAEVHTSLVTNVSSMGALCGGQALGSGILDKGVVWSTSPNITVLSMDTISIWPLGGAGDFTCDLTGRISQNRVYYIRAFARNSSGIGFGEEYRFYTGCNTLILNETVTENTNCQGSTGSIQIDDIVVQFGLDAPYTYSWTGPNGFTANTSEIIDLESGEYEVTVSDVKGCPTVKSYEVSEPSPYVITVDNILPASCATCPDGTIEINISGGTGDPYTDWAGPDSYESTSEDISGLLPGLYSVQAYDPFGCAGQLLDIEVIVENTLVVVNTDDYDQSQGDMIIPGSLRQAIEKANLVPGKNFIRFEIPGTGPHTIELLTGLPHITDTLIIDGYTQSGAQVATETTPASLMIELDGINLIDDHFTCGLWLSAPQCVIRGLMINRFGDNGIHIGTPGECTVEGNWFGLDATGLIMKANYDGAVRITDSPNNIVGGNVPAQRNVMAAERHHLISILLAGSFNNEVKGNYLGVGPDGNSKRGDSEFGIRISDQAHHNTIGPYNLISGQRDAGIQFEYNNPNNNTIIGNLIGTNYNGISAIPNQWGIRIYNSADNVIGGDLGVKGNKSYEGNIVSGNNGNGIWIEGEGATGNWITGNYIGLAADGITPLPNEEFGVKIRETSGNTIGGMGLLDGNVISGNVKHGILIEYDVSGNGNEVYRNKIGTDYTGNIAVPNQQSGVVILESSHNKIGVAHNGNLISGNNSSGVLMWGDSANYNIIQGNDIGIGKDGKDDIPLPNNFAGVGIHKGSNNSIGGAGVGEGNVISNNRHWGLWIGWEEATNNRVIGNYIGTDPSGTEAMGNGYDQPDEEGAGIRIYQSSGNTIGGSEPGEGNIISNNQKYGIIINGSVKDDNVFPASDNYILGNLIGTDKTGMLDMGNEIGIQIDTASNNFIGGELTSERNIISGNDLHGIMINSQFSSENTILGNYIGTDITGLLARPNDVNGILIDGGRKNLIGGETYRSRNYIAGNGENGIYIDFSDQRDTAKWNMIKGNFIGLSIDGKNVLQQSNVGVLIKAPQNFIGGTNPGAGNVISGNLNLGIQIFGKDAIGNYIQGNNIGLDSTGTKWVENWEVGNNAGIGLHDCYRTLVGGAIEGAGNVISGNQGGIGISSSTQEQYPSEHQIFGNFIGTDYSGSDSVGNRYIGITISYATDNTIGGSNTLERNIISGNGSYGVYLTFNSNNEVKGNFIGTDITGTKSIANREAGILFGRASNNNIAGGSETNEGNLISGNLGSNILIDGDIHCDGNIIQGNLIGTDISGTKALCIRKSTHPYMGVGIRIREHVTNTLIGGMEPGEGNIIAYNGNYGIGYHQLENEGFGNRILSNSIHSNGNIGIDLNADLVTVNDAGDGDVGPNNLQNYPVLNNVAFSQNKLDITGSLNSAPNADYLIQYFVSPEADDSEYGEGATYVGSNTVTTDATGNNSFSASFETLLRDGLVVTATATDMQGNTSEFCEAIGGAENQVAITNMPMHYVINDQGLPYVEDNSDFQALQNAFDAWEAIPSSVVDFEYDGTTTQTKAVANDGINLITFADESFFITDEVLGLAAKTLYMDDTDGTAEIVDADIVFNPFWAQGEERFSTETVDGIFDLQSIATHEIGHTFGMIHSGVLESTMFFAVMEHDTEKRTLEQDDISWASYRYPGADYDATFGSIAGTILYGDLDDTPAVGGALVVATNTSTGAAIHSYSDENGNFLVPGLPDGSYQVSIEPLDGNVHGYNLTDRNISYYIDGITIYTDFPNEFYNGVGEGAVNDDPTAYEAVNVVAGNTTTLAHNLVTNKDDTPPEIIVVTPKNDSTGVDVLTQVFMGFTEPVNIATFTDENCYLTLDQEPVYGSFTLADNYGRRIAFTPNKYPLEFSSTYTLHLTDEVQDLKGNGLVGNNQDLDHYTSLFTTIAKDDISPVLTDILPDDGNDTVFINANVMVFFNEAMDAETTVDGFSLVDGSGAVVEGSYAWKDDLKMLTFNPFSNLKEGRSYTVSVDEGLKDLSGNPLEKDSLLTFSIIPQLPPQIVLVGPYEYQDQVSLESPLVIGFTEPIDPQTINGETVQLLLNDYPLEGQFEFVYDNSRVIFRPSNQLAVNTTYDVVISDQIYDMSEPPDHLEQGMIYEFTTGETVSEPYIEHLHPSSGAYGTVLMIGGEGLDPNPDNMKVLFLDTEAVIIQNQVDDPIDIPTAITTIVPYGAEPGMVHVEVNTQVSTLVSNEEYFYVVPDQDHLDSEIRRTTSSQSSPQDVHIDPDAAFAYITNSGANSISRLNMVNFDVESIPVGQMPVQIDIHPNGKMAYVTNYLSHDVSVIDLELLKVVQTIPVGINPFGIVASPNGDQLYVANSTTEDVMYIDVDPNSGGYDRVVGSVRTLASNKGIDISPDAALALIACDEGILFLITDPDHVDYNTINRTVNTGSSASSVHILPDAGMGIAVTDDNYLVMIDILPGDNYGNVVGRVSTKSSVSDIAISPDGLFIYATHTEINEISVFQINYTGAPDADASVNVSAELELIRVIKVDEAPHGIAIDPRAEKVLVTHFTSNGQITEIEIGKKVDLFSSLEDLIFSIEDLISSGALHHGQGNALISMLNAILHNLEKENPKAAVNVLNAFIKKVENLMDHRKLTEPDGLLLIEQARIIIAELQAGTKSAEIVTGIVEFEVHGEPALGPIYPNPFEESTIIQYRVSSENGEVVPVRIEVYNSTGQLVTNLVEMKMSAGSYSVEWNGRYEDERLVSDGIYYVRMMAGEVLLVEKAVVIR